MNHFEQLKNRLEFSESRFKAIAQTASDSIVIADENSIVVFANQKTCEIFGYTEAELIGTDLGQLMPETYREAHKAGTQRFIKTNKPKLIGHTIEIEGLRKDGSIFPLELSLSAWKEEGNYFFSGIIRDITRRKQAMLEKEEANRRLQDQQQELQAANEKLQQFQEELQAANEELQASHEELNTVNDELLQKEKLLTSWNSELEEKVLQRTRYIEEQRKWLHNLFMQVPALIGILKGREGVVTLFNQKFSKLFSNRELLGKSMREVWPELEGQGYFELLERVYDTAEPVVRNESPAVIDWHNNGQPEQGFFNFIYAPHYDLQGEVEGIIIYAEDVTAQVMARKAIEESATRLHFMANAMPQKVWTTKPDGHADYFNQKWLEYTNMSLEELKGWGWKSSIHPDDWEENEKMWIKSTRTGKSFQLEHRIKRKDGQYRWHLSRGLAQRDDTGAISMWIGTSTDIHDHKLAQEKLILTQDELRKSNQELNKTNRDLDNFIYTASHDLKSPLVNLEGLIGLAARKDKPAEQEAALLKMMESSVSRLKRTITELAEITKVQKRLSGDAEKVSFSEMLTDIKEDMLNSIKEAEVTIREELEVPSVFFPKKDLRSILYNLLSNAIKYRSSERKPMVTISTYYEGDSVVLSVADNGLGLSEQQLPKIFDMFKRLHSHVEGTGIGLYIVKRIVENNEGSIEVESKLNTGTTFRVHFSKGSHT